MKAFECRYQVLRREDTTVVVIAESLGAAEALFLTKHPCGVQMIRVLDDVIIKEPRY